MPELIPLVLLASEIGCGVKELSRRCNGAVVRDDTGFRCVPAELAHEVISEQIDKLETERERRRAERGQPKRHGTRERVRAIAAQQQRVDGDSLPESAYRTVVNDEATEALERAGRRRDEMTSGTMVYRPFSALKGE